MSLIACLSKGKLLIVSGPRGNGTTLPSRRDLGAGTACSSPFCTSSATLLSVVFAKDSLELSDKSINSSSLSAPGAIVNKVKQSQDEAYSQLTEVTVVSPTEPTICACSDKLRALIWVRFNDTHAPSAFIVFAEAAWINRLSAAGLHQRSRQCRAVSQWFAYRLAVCVYLPVQNADCRQFLVSLLRLVWVISRNGQVGRVYPHDELFPF